ncbi:AAA family ATPase [Vibrio maritimus]
MGEPVPISKNMGDNVTYALRTNLNVWVLYATDAFKNHITSELKKSKNTICEPVSLNLVSTDALRTLHAPDVIFVEGKMEWATKVAELHDYDLPFKDSDASLIVFGDESDTAMLRVALRIGASDFLSEHAGMSDLLPILQTMAEQKIVNRDMGELFIFLNTKGGNGASTMAINVALQLAESFPNEVLLIDVDTQFGTVPEYLDLTPRYTMFDALEVMSELDESSINGIVTKYQKRLHILGFGKGQGANAAEKAEKIQKIVPLFRQFYKYIIIDFSRGVEPTFAPLITPATKLFLVVQQNYMSLKNASQLSKSLKYEYGLTTEAIEVIVNRYSSKQAITLADVDKTLPDYEIHNIPNDYKVATESANLGKPVIDFKKKSAISKAIAKLSVSLGKVEAAPSGWLSKLFS